MLHRLRKPLTDAIPELAEMGLAELTHRRKLQAQHDLPNRGICRHEQAVRARRHSVNLGEDTGGAHHCHRGKTLRWYTSARSVARPSSTSPLVARNGGVDDVPARDVLTTLRQCNGSTSPDDHLCRQSSVPKGGAPPRMQ